LLVAAAMSPRSAREEFRRLASALHAAEEQAQQGAVSAGRALLEAELERAWEQVRLWEEALRLYCDAYNPDDD
jgi:hypothetical protein